MLIVSITTWFVEAVSSEVLIESKESKTKELNPVFNKIAWKWGLKKDVWMMNQSHHGLKADPKKWDRLAIVVDKTKTPFEATYYEVQPGDLSWSESWQQQRVNFKVSCFICHNNGPRALRPNYNSLDAPLDFKQRIKIAFWNLRIKTYGRITYNKDHDRNDKILAVPFSHKSNADQTPLNIPACLKCHNESGFLARGLLRRQQTTTIRHLVDQGEMPPPGFTLSRVEKEQLENYLRGF